MILSDDLFAKFVEMVYRRTGLHFENNKKYLVQKRIEKRMSDLSIEDFKEYYQSIKFSLDQTEFNTLVDELTTNETYFFRDFPQLQNFAEEVLPVIIKQKQKEKDYTLKIWSAASSTGEEAYTLSIILLEMLDNPELWNIEILASDINNYVLERAKDGVYENRSIKDVPEVYLEKYFSKRNSKYCIKLNAKKNVKFKNINLYDSSEMLNYIDFDVIFCRNCLIYFDDESRKKVLKSFYSSLKQGGFIFLGHSESVNRIESSFKSQRIGNTVVYSKY